MVWKSGVSGRAADLRLDRIAKEAAAAVRQAGDGGGRATERFLGRMLDHLHDSDNEHRGLYDPSPSRQRRRKKPD